MNKIGEYLRKLRTEKHLTIDEVSAATGIRSQYLDALEKCEYNKIPGDVFIKGFIRNYGNSLGADGNALVEEYKQLTRSAAKVAETAVDSVEKDILETATPTDADVQAAIDAVVSRNKQRTKPKASFGQGIKNALGDIKSFIYDNLYETIEEDDDEYEEELEQETAAPQPVRAEEKPPVDDATQRISVPEQPLPVRESITTAAAASAPEKSYEQPKEKKSFFNFKVFAGVFLVLLLVFGGVMGYFMFGNKGANNANVTSKVASGVKSAHSSDKAKDGAAEQKSAAQAKTTAEDKKTTDAKKDEKAKTATVTKGSGDGLVVEITYKEPVWTQVTADGKTIEAVTVPKGATRVYKGNKEVKVNLGALRNVVMKVNGKVVTYADNEWGEGTKVFKK